MDYLRRWLDRCWAALPAVAATKIVITTLGALVLLTAVAMALQPSGMVLAALYAPLFGVLLVLVMRSLRFDAGTSLIVLVAYSLYLGYLSYTGYEERNYDAAAQVEYIEYILEHGAYPPGTQCFVCHHPPLYYALSAVPYAFFERTNLLPPERGLQLFSLALFVVFLLFSVQLVRRFTTDVRRIRVAAALVAFWPHSFVNSVRVHNDSLVTTLMIAALYFTVCWQQENKQRDVLLAGAFAALAVLTKSSAYIVVGTLLALVGYRLLRSPERRTLIRHAIMVVAMIALAMTINRLRASDEHVEIATTPRVALCQKLLGPACDLYPPEWVDDEPLHYVWLDVPSFLAEPYVVHDREDVRRDYFLNHLAKTSLFGSQYAVADPETSYALNAKVAAIMNVLLLGMMGFLLVALAHLDRRRVRRYGVVLFAVALFGAFAAAFGFLIPAPHHCDFRHIFPVLALASLGYASAVGFFRARRPWLAHVGVALAGVFLALSVFYFLPKYDWSVRLMARTVPAELSRYATVVRDGTSWNKKGNLVIDGNNTIELTVAPPRTVSAIDISVDNNDIYEIELVGSTETRTIVVGPSPNVRGLARYVPTMEPPVVGVGKARVRAKRGDRVYVMGHFILR